MTKYALFKKKIIRIAKFSGFVPRPRWLPRLGALPDPRNVTNTYC